MKSKNQEVINEQIRKCLTLEDLLSVINNEAFNIHKKSPLL